MMTFEVRHWYSNHEAGINGERPGNTIGNTFYGSKGYLVIDNYNKYYSFMGKDRSRGPPGPSATSTSRTSSPACAAASGRTERRDRRRRAVVRADAPGQHFLPVGPHATLGRENWTVKNKTPRRTGC